MLHLHFIPPRLPFIQNMLHLLCPCTSPHQTSPTLAFYSLPCYPSWWEGDRIPT